MSIHDILLVKVSLGYADNYPKHRSMVEKANKAFSAANIDKVFDVQEEKEGERNYYHIDSWEGIIGAEQLITVLEHGFEVNIKSRYKINGPQRDFLSLKEQVELLIDKIDQIDRGVFPQGHGQFNNKCDVHVPGMGLMLINRTMLLEDSCTDALQLHLTDGWRIIAACPQGDQRRPDYILGRYEPSIADKDNGYADRG